jgi:hypothetical protein
MGISFHLTAPMIEPKVLNQRKALPRGWHHREHGPREISP